MSKPGPWTYMIDGDANCYHIIANNNWLMAIRHNGEPLVAEQLINIKMICAAREMLHALQMVQDADEDCKRDGLPTIPPIARATIDHAIAKATV